MSSAGGGAYLFEHPEPTVQEQADEVERELVMRERVYPRMVQNGKMSQTKADAHMRAMGAALKTLRGLQ